MPLVGTFHRFAERPGWYRVFRPLCRVVLRRLALRVAVSEAARRHVAATCPGPYDVVPNGRARLVGVDADEVRAAAAGLTGVPLRRGRARTRTTRAATR